VAGAIARLVLLARVKAAETGFASRLSA
jgi:hypothetical protein